MAEVEEDEEVFYEGRGAPAELIVSLLLGATLIYLVSDAQCDTAASKPEFHLKITGSSPTKMQIESGFVCLQPLTAQSIGRRLWISYK